MANPGETAGAWTEAPAAAASGTPAGSAAGSAAGSPAGSAAGSTAAPAAGSAAAPASGSTAAPAAGSGSPAAAGPAAPGLLQRVLGLRTLVSASAGLAFAAVNFLAVTEVLSQSGGALGPVALGAAAVLCLLAAACFSELNGRLPSAAGIRAWTLQGLGDPFSLTFTLLYLTTVLLVIGADGFVLASALQAVLPAVPGFLWIVAFLSAALFANLRGVRSAGLVQDLTTYALLAALIVISAVALAGPAPAALPAVAGAGAGGFADAIALGVFVFMGFEWVTPLAEEAREPRAMPAALGLSLLLLAVGFGLFAAVAGRLPAAGGGLAPQLVVGRRALGAAGFWVMLGVTVVTAGTTFNGGFVAASRLLYALGRSRHLPASLARLNARFVPHRALWLLWGVSVVLTLAVFASGRYLLLINAGATLECAMYVVAALALLGMRRRRPDLVPTWRAPGGRALPWAAVVVFGLLGIGAATTATGLPLPGVPWTLVLLAVLAGAALLYARRALRRRGGGVGDGRALRA